MKTVFTTVACFAAAASIASGAAHIEIDDQSSIDIGFRLQPLLIVTESDLDGDGVFDTDTDFKVRRGRLRLKGIWACGIENQMLRRNRHAIEDIYVFRFPQRSFP